MNYLPNDFSFPVSLGIFGMKLPFKKHQLNLQTSTGFKLVLIPILFFFMRTDSPSDKAEMPAGCN